MLKAYHIDRLFYFTETRKNYIKVLVYIWCMKQVTLGSIEIGGSFRFGGVWFRVRQLASDNGEFELIYCEIFNLDPRVIDNHLSMIPEIIGTQSYCYIANHAIVEVQ